MYGSGPLQAGGPAVGLGASTWDQCDMPDIQPKLTVNEPGDKYEKEAERLADAVLRMPEPKEGVDTEERLPADRILRMCPRCQRRHRQSKTLDCEGCEAALQRKENSADKSPTVDSGVQQQISPLSGGGRMLPASMRSFFEPRFGRDFRAVRVHDTPQADHLARSIDAVGFTHGTDIGFRRGSFQPGTPSGKELIAHELVHVIQQDEGATQRPSAAHRALADGVVQRTPANGGQGGYTPAPGTGGQQGSGPMSMSQSREPPESGETPFNFSAAPEPDPTCRDISDGAKVTLKQILGAVNSEVEGFVKWRTGQSWDSEAGQRIPRIEFLQRQFQRLTNTIFTCADDPTKALPPDDPLIKEYLFSGIGDEEGMTESDVNYINEWMQYEGDRSIPSIQRYFGLSPQPIRHEYGVQIELAGTLFGAGAGFGGKLKFGDIGGEFGCFLDVEGSAAWVEFQYSNDLGMRWTVEYLAGDVSVGPECSIGASVGGVDTSFGTESLCTGDASSPFYYGPTDFAGAQTGWNVGVGGGIGIGFAGGGSSLTVYPSSRLPSLTFDTSGACAQVILGVDVKIGEGAASFGGQIDISDADLTTATVQDVYDLVLGPLYEILPAGRRTLVTRHMFYDTGSSDTLSGAYASHNEFAIRDLAAALDEAGRVFPPDEVEFVLTGHASPRWRAAETPREAAEENRALAGRRVEDARNTILAMYQQYLDLGGWPPASFSVPEISVINLTETGPFTVINLGPSVGLAETGDPRNDAQLYRRVTAELIVAHYRERRLNVIDLFVPPSTPILYCPFLPQSQTLEQ